MLRLLPPLQSSKNYVRVLNDEEKETNKKREEEQVHEVFAMITSLAIYYITIVKEIIGM